MANAVETEEKTEKAVQRWKPELCSHRPRTPGNTIMILHMIYYIFFQIPYLYCCCKWRLLEFVCVSGLLMIFRKAVNFWTLTLFLEAFSKNFLKLTMCQHLIAILHAYKEKMLFVSQLEYFFLVEFLFFFFRKRMDQM